MTTPSALKQTAPLGGESSIMKFGALHLLSRTNTPGAILIASMHWGWSITWRWVLWYRRPKGGKWGYYGRRYPDGVIANIATPLGRLHFISQSNLRENN